MRKNILFAVIAIVLVSMSRFLPHPPNFTAIGAMALFGGATLGRSNKWWLLLPILVMFLTDFMLEVSTGMGYHEGIPFVYASFLLIGGLGYLALRKSQSTGKVVLTSLAASIIFFVLSNLGVFLTSTMYAKDVSGLISCFAAAIPFYNNDVFGSFLFNTILADLFFNAMLFGSLALYSKVYLKEAVVKN